MPVAGSVKLPLKAIFEPSLAVGEPGNWSNRVPGGPSGTEKYGKVSPYAGIRLHFLDGAEQARAGGE